MKDIKEKVRDKNPKIRNPASRLPKELVRSAMLETKEKSRMVADKVGRETGEESPVEYAGNRIERAEQRAGKESASVAYHGGKKLAVKTYEKIKEQRQKLHDFLHHRGDLRSGGKGIRTIKCSEKGIDISGKKTRPHSCKAEQKEFCLPFSHAQGGNQQRRCHADKNIFHICHACTALPVAGSRANTQPVSRTSNP